MSEELKPCPFCGAPAHLEDADEMGAWVICTSISGECPVEPVTRHYETPAEAITAWNRRVTP